MTSICSQVSINEVATTDTGTIRNYDQPLDHKFSPIKNFPDCIHAGVRGTQTCKAGVNLGEAA